LPSMTGYEVAKKIRSLPGGEHVRLVALTGWGTEAGIHRASHQARRPRTH
jgi:CheY-like chemotaxis protein